MPTFEFLSVRDAHLELALRGGRGEILREYMGYIEQLAPEHAGRLTAAEGESTAAIRRRLGAAAQLLGKRLEVTRDGRGGLLLGGSGGPSASPRQNAQQ